MPFLDVYLDYYSDVHDGGQTVSPAGIGSSVAFGSVIVSVGGIGVYPAGIPTGYASGAESILSGGVTLSPVGIISTETVPSTLQVGQIVIISPSGISSSEAFGIPVTPEGIIPGINQKGISYWDGTNLLMLDMFIWNGTVLVPFQIMGYWDGTKILPLVAYYNTDPFGLSIDYNGDFILSGVSIDVNGDFVIPDVDSSVDSNGDPVLI